jgi:hypothetical protein
LSARKTPVEKSGSRNANVADQVEAVADPFRRYEYRSVTRTGDLLPDADVIADQAHAWAWWKIADGRVP